MNFAHAQQVLEQAWWPVLRAGLVLTIPMALISFAFGLVLGLAAALARLGKSRWRDALARFYIWIFRGTPLLVQLFIVFFGLPSAGIRINAVPAAVLTFSLNVGAYASETIRAAITSVDRGQWEAAESLGMTYAQALRRIIGPQALRVALPPLGNTFIALVKDTSLAANITVAEMFMSAQRIAARTYEPLLLYLLVAVFYLAMCTILTALQEKLEARTALVPAKEAQT